MNYISSNQLLKSTSNNMEEEEVKELFKQADLKPKNEDLNNFYADSLVNAKEVLKSTVTKEIIHLIAQKQIKSPID